MEFNFLTTATLSLLPIVAILEKLEGVWSTESGIEQKGELEVEKKKKKFREFTLWILEGVKLFRIRG